MNESYVELQGFQVMRVRADMEEKGPSEAFDILESKLPTLRGRKFYGTFRKTSDGEEYYACVALKEGDDPSRMGLETGLIPGGRYLRRKIFDWEKMIRSGELPKIFGEIVGANIADSSRPSIEFYRSRTELQILVPVKGSPETLD